MLDKNLMETTLHDIDNIRADILGVNESVDMNHPHYKSLLNLKQYLALRSKDRTKVQEKLFLLSLSSLGRSYAHVAGSVETLYEQLNSSLYGHSTTPQDINSLPHLNIQEAIELASKNSTRMFGGKVSSKLSKQTTAIMVTLPSNAADDDGKLIYELAHAGVNAFRINTAHDDALTWKGMADVIAKINIPREENNKIKIFVDLGGPKIRTGSIRKLEIPVVMGSNKVQKELLIYHSKEINTVAETTDEVTQKKEPAHIVINNKFFKRLKEGTVFRVVDVNEKKVLITVSQINGTYAKAYIDKKVYLDKSSRLYKKKHEGFILNIEMQVEPIRLFKGDILNITEEDIPGHAAIYDDKTNSVDYALISCSFNGIAEHIDIGEKIYIDDGKIGLVVIEKKDKLITCKVILAKGNGTVLKEEKGINFPDSHVKTAALTDTDRINALSVMDFVDTLSLSFCQTAEDVRDLQNLLRENNRTDIGIVTKIETKQAVVNMPEILEELLNWEKSGVMIARGDLAIEVGFQNMAHIQEALLDICDAAHMPVIWATQVLESQMKTNLPSRAEITDAAMSGRADCVMLNKGAFATDTIGVLIHILDDMHNIFKKNRQLLSREMLWQAV